MTGASPNEPFAPTCQSSGADLQHEIIGRPRRGTVQSFAPERPTGATCAEPPFGGFGPMPGVVSPIGRRHNPKGHGRNA